MNTEINETFNADTENEEKIQYILNENKELVEIPKSAVKTVEYPIKYKLENAFEVFVRVKGTENYWISNYGRCVNNLNRKDKNKFYKHKEGKCHYTVYEIERAPKRVKGKLTDEIEVNRYKRETSPEELVAETFLVLQGDKYHYKVWHKDGDETNNWYKNLVYVPYHEYKNLLTGKVTWQELNINQEYIEYENKACHHAYIVYGGIKTRCGDTKDDENIRACYDNSTMWEGWLNDPKLFVKWYLEHYYEVDGESMAVDKDLFGDGSGMYHPDFCCVLPQGLNTLLANSKKHYFKDRTDEEVLPLGVGYNGKNGKYFASIQFCGTDQSIRLSDWDTPEEAFAEYKLMKQADICRMAAEYRKNIPDYIYKKLLTIEVKPY